MSNKLTSKINAKAIISLIPTVVFAAFILTMAIATTTDEAVQDAITSTELSAESLEELSDTFEETLQDNIYQKNNYINLNGLSTRLLGINTLNERYKLANGHLSKAERVYDISYPAANIIKLNEFLNTRDIEFLYVLAPSHDSMYDVEFAPGYSSDAWQNIDNMINALNEAGVNYLDMDAWFEDNGWTMDDVFFKTDHHWLPEAAFASARCTMEMFVEEGITDYDPDLLNEANWTITVLKDWLLGGAGKRTGLLYTGLDDISVYVPNFETDYIYSYLKQNSTSWVYLNDCIDWSYTLDTDYFNWDVYDGIYIGNYPIKRIINTDASSDKRVLIVGDSFSNPYQYFLSTQFQEIYTVDLRYYKDGTFAQYIEEIQPDIVIMCTYSGELANSSIYTFGISDYLTALEATDKNTEAIELGDFVIDVNNNNDNFSVIYSELQAGQTYTLTVDSTGYTGGNDLYVQMTLQDLSTNEAIYNRYFDANSDEEQKWIFDVPDSNDTYAIYFYAGTKGHTSGVSAGVTGVTLYEGVIEW